MLTKDGCHTRLARLRDSVPEGSDAIVIHLPEHLLYLANFFPLPNSLNYHSSSFLLADKDGGTTLFVDNWLADPKEAAVDEVVVSDWYTSTGAAQNRAAVVAKELRSRLDRLKVKTLAAEASHLPSGVAAGLQSVVDIEPHLRDLRQIKDADEVKAIERGIRTAEAIHHASRDLVRPGMTELEFYSQLVARAIVAAGAPFVMMCDLASGPRAAAGGGAPTRRTMHEGELVIMDMFPYVEGYRGDIANTLVVGGHPSQEQQDLFETVLAGLHAGEEKLRPGTPVKEIHRAIDARFRDSRSDRRLTHHAGHAIGLGHPEAPELVPESDAILRQGMVLTLEPGLYGVSTGGIRLEHNYLITEDGFRRLSNHKLSLN